MIAISTLQNSLGHDDGARLLAELNELGFNEIQLDCQITERLLEQMIPQFKIGMKVVSIHNFCPLPPNVPQEDADADLFLLSSPFKYEREEAVKHTIKTIELAVDLEERGAWARGKQPVVVLHLGYVDVRDESKKLFDLYEWGEREFEAFSKIVTEICGKRERKQQKYHDAIMFSLDELNERAFQLGVLLALENRPRYRQIPDFYELEWFFSEFEGGNLRYWHDAAHAALQEAVGILKHEKLLKAYSEQLIGIELHDIKELDEYLAPGTGELDFKEIWQYVSADAIKVMEVKEAADEEIIEGRKMLEEGGENGARSIGGMG